MKVYLVTRPTVDWEMVEQFLADEELPSLSKSIVGVGSGISDGEGIVEISARLCYMSYGRGRKDVSDFVNNLLSSKDGSVFEHIVYGFVVTGISRSLSHELVRHRAGFAYSQRSQRYVDEGNGEFVMPEVMHELSENVTERFDLAAQSAQHHYRRLVKWLDEELPDVYESATARRKAVRQAARSVLPNATETKMFVSANVRAWRHFIEMRATEYADPEIRSLAMEILPLLQNEAPLLFNDFEIIDLPDGTTGARPLHSKV